MGAGYPSEKLKRDGTAARPHPPRSGRTGRGNFGRTLQEASKLRPGIRNSVDCRRAAYCCCSRSATRRSAIVGSRRFARARSEVGRSWRGCCLRIRSRCSTTHWRRCSPGGRPSGGRPLLFGQGRLHPRLQPLSRSGAGRRDHDTDLLLAVIRAGAAGGTGRPTSPLSSLAACERAVLALLSRGWELELTPAGRAD
jgi:hypothetical protein